MQPNWTYERIKNGQKDRTHSQNTHSLSTIKLSPTLSMCALMKTLVFLIQRHTQQPTRIGTNGFSPYPLRTQTTPTTPTTTGSTIWFKISEPLSTPKHTVEMHISILESCNTPMAVYGDMIYRIPFRTPQSPTTRIIKIQNQSRPWCPGLNQRQQSHSVISIAGPLYIGWPDTNWFVEIEPFPIATFIDRPSSPRNQRLSEPQSPTPLEVKMTPPTVPADTHRNAATLSFPTHSVSLNPQNRLNRKSSAQQHLTPPVAPFPISNSKGREWSPRTMCTTTKQQKRQRQRQTTTTMTRSAY